MNIESNIDPPAKTPWMLSPRWFWLMFCSLFQMFKPEFWRKLRSDPDVMASYNVSSLMTVFSGVFWYSAWEWAKVNAPLVVNALSFLGGAIKALAVFVWTVVVALVTAAVNGVTH